MYLVDVLGDVDDEEGADCPVGKAGDWIFAVGVAAGYAGASPFSEGNAWYGKATAVALRQFSESDALVLVLDYDGNRTLLPDVPLPGIAYTHRVSPSLFYVIGAPVTPAGNSVSQTTVPLALS